jgi:hemoglobin
MRRDPAGAGPAGPTRDLRHRAIAWYACAAMLCGCAVLTPPSLYDRLGGEDAIGALVDTFVGNVLDDDRIKSYFAKTNIPRLKLMLIDQLCASAGGPCPYTGEDMKTAHRGRHIGDAQFDAMKEDFAKSLGQLRLAAAERRDLLALFEAMRAEVVETGRA